MVFLEARCVKCVDGAVGFNSYMPFPQFGDMVRFFRIGDERSIPDEYCTSVRIAQGGTSVASLLISQHRVSGLLLDFQKAVGGWRVRRKVNGLGLFLNVEQFESGGETGDVVVDDSAGDGGCVGLPDQVVFAAGAVESGDRGRFVEVLVDGRDEFDRQVCECCWCPG